MDVSGSLLPASPANEQHYFSASNSHRGRVRVPSASNRTLLPPPVQHPERGSRNGEVLRWKGLDSVSTSRDRDSAFSCFPLLGPSRTKKAAAADALNRTASLRHGNGLVNIEALTGREPSPSDDATHVAAVYGAVDTVFKYNQNQVINPQIWSRERNLAQQIWNNWKYNFAADVFLPLVFIGAGISEISKDNGHTVRAVGLEVIGGMLLLISTALRVRTQNQRNGPLARILDEEGNGEAKNVVKNAWTNHASQELKAVEDALLRSNYLNDHLAMHPNDHLATRIVMEHLAVNGLRREAAQNYLLKIGMPSEQLQMISSVVNRLHSEGSSKAAALKEAAEAEAAVYAIHESDATREAMVQAAVVNAYNNTFSAEERRALEDAYAAIFNYLAGDGARRPGVELHQASPAGTSPAEAALQESHSGDVRISVREAVC